MRSSKPRSPQAMIRKESHQVVVGLLMGAYLMLSVVCLLLASVGAKPHYYEETCGLLMANAALLGVWASLAEGRWPRRLPAVACLVGVEFLVVTRGLGLAVALSLVALPLVALLPLLLVRSLLGIRLVDPDQSVTLPNVQPTQFTLRELLLWVTGAAVFLALARFMTLHHAGKRFSGMNDLVFGWRVIISLTLCAVGLLALLGWPYRSRRRMLFSWLAVLLLVATPFLARHFFARELAMSKSIDANFLRTLGVYLLAVAFGLGCIRLAGYRLQRLSRAEITG